LTLLLGYLFFIDFIVREGVQHMGLRAEMTLAERTHRALVPPLDLRTGRLEVYGESRPSSQVGGDLLDATELDGEALLYVADVSGHGVAAGTLMSLTKGALRSRVLAGVSLSTLVGDLNRVLLDLSSPNMFVTLAALHFGDGDTVEVCLAGHLPILHFRERDGAVHALRNQNLPLGLLPGTTFETSKVTYGAGDLFAILTDGLTEVENEAGEEFGVEGVERLIGRSINRPLAHIHAAVVDGVGAHGPQLDDQTLLLIRVP
jgi:serine phosphatase RsbU (regulator of sigma subunit)